MASAIQKLTNNVINIHHAVNSLTVSNEENINDKITDICLRHQNNRKWILVIDSDKSTRATLSSQENIDKSRILHINSHKVRLSANNIETALAKGNCSAVVLMENYFQQEQIQHLDHCAKQTNTTFMVLKNASGMH